MWRLGHKIVWESKNWCFLTVVLEKTPESSLDSKEIKPVNLKGDQPWIFTGRTDAEAPAVWTWSSSPLCASDDQNSVASASASVLPVNIQDWSPIRLTGLISLLSKELSGVFSSIQFGGINSLVFCLLYSLALTIVYDHWEDHSLDLYGYLLAE